MAIAAIGQVISTAHVPAATPATAVTPSLRLWIFSTMFDDPNNNGGGICAPRYAGSAVLAPQGEIVP
jgi:hypothetical protein